MTPGSRKSRLRGDESCKGTPPGAVPLRNRLRPTPKTTLGARHTPGGAAQSAAKLRRGGATAWALAAAGVLALALVAGLLWAQRSRTASFYSDDATIRVPVEQAARRDVLWQPPVKLAEALNTTEEDYEPRLSWDENTLYLVRGKAAGDQGAGNADIYVAHRTPSGWSEPTPLSAVNSDYDDLGPEPARDGAALYFYSNRPGGSGGYDIWVSRLADGEWQPPTNLGPAVNSPFNDYGPALAPDQTRLFLASNRPLPQDATQPNADAWPATVREDLYRRTYDLYGVVLSERGPEAARPLAALNTPYNEGAACVAPGGDFLYFSSDRPGGMGGFDLYRARFVRGALRAPESLGPAINSAANELDPALAALGFGLIFSSDRPVVRVQPGRPNDYNLYYSASRDVFVETESLRPPGVDFAALWRKLLPNLLWALLALLAFLLLLAIFRDWQRRKLSLLARCLLASLAAHALLMFLTTFWRVTSTVVGAMRGDGGGEIRVALGPAGGGAESLERQLLGAITDVPTPDAVLAAAAPLEAHIDAQPAAAEAVLAAARSTVTDVPAPLTLIARETAPPPPENRPAPAATPAGDAPLALNTPAEAARVSSSEEETLSAPAQAGAVGERLSAPVEVSAAASGGTVALPAPRVAAVNETSLVAAGAPRAADAAQPATPTAPVRPIDLPGPTEAALSVAVPRDAPSQAGPATGGVEHETSTTLRALPGGGAPAETARAPSAAHDGAGARLANMAPARSNAAGENASFSSGSAAAAKDASPNVRTPGLATSQPVASATPLPLTNLKLPSTPGEVAAAGSPADERAARPPIAAAQLAGAARASLEPIDLPGGAARVMNLPIAARSHASGGSLADRSGQPRDATVALPIGGAGRPQGGDSPVRTVGALDLAPAAIRLPDETAAPTNADTLAERGGARPGGNPRVDGAVQRALAWLVKHQSGDGHWDGDAFDDGCGECDGATPHAMDVTLTSLSTLALLGAGHSPAKDGPYRDNLVRAVAWLRARQREDGDLRAGETMYSHAIATLALAETLAVTKDPALEEPLRRAVEVIVRAPNLRPTLRYEDDDLASGNGNDDPPEAAETAAASRRRAAGPRRAASADADTAVLGWQVMALHSARLAGVAVPPEPLAEAQRWLARVEDRDTPGAYAFKPGQPPSDAMTAEGLLIQLMLGAPRDDARTRGSVELIGRLPPRWKPEPNAYYWFFATFALFHVEGEPWARWNEQLIQQLVANQERGGRRDGSWPAVGRYAEAGGRVYQTALCTLMLESGRKLLPMLAAVKDDAGGGVLRGQVTSTVGDRPLPGALVRADIAGGVPVAAYAGPDGRYELFFPVMPPHFALTASHPGYLPKSENIASAELQRGATQDFALEPRARDRIVLEPVPDVHHLGNDRFEGAINSQFQKMSEGQLYRETFDLPEGPPPLSARLTLMIRGVQCPHPVRINGEQIGTLRNSPPDGSFGRLTLRFDGSVLLPGRNVIEIQGISCTGDLDDFEFVNVQIQIEQ